MTDNRAITWEETDDPNACQTNETVYQLYTRDPVRTPFQWDDTMHAGFSTAQKTWLPVHQNYRQINLKTEKAAAKSTYKFYQHLLKLRQTDIFKHGGFRSMAVNDQVFAFVRTYGTLDPVVVFINLGDRIDLSVKSILSADELPPNVIGRVIAATHTSNYEMDSLMDPNNFALEKYDAIAVRIESGEWWRSGVV
jgi:alpha-glucosidase